MSDGWLSSAFTSLPATDDEIFKRLWSDNLLVFDGSRDVADSLDDYCARLVSSALRRRQKLLVSLPDLQPHRPALLFATALLRSWWDSRTAQELGERVLYFGSIVGIRNQLRRTSLRNLGFNLADVFGQTDIGRNADAGLPTRSAQISGLPQVATIYAPTNPAAIIHSYRPNWIAIDCADVPSLPWLRPLLQVAREQDIPIIAWGQNCLADWVVEFADYGNVFEWPPRLSSDVSKLEGDVESLCNPKPTSIGAVVLSGTNANSFSASLREASEVLATATQHATNNFTRDALAVHWRYLRTLEMLAVPLDFYEAEAPRFWGMKSTAQIRAACSQFRKASEGSSSQLYARLEEFDSVMDRPMKQLEDTGCPLWNALSNACIEETDPNEARLIVFPSDSRKLLFVFALLARHNISDDDLRELRIWVTTLRELRRWMHRRYSLDSIDSDDPMMPPVSLKWCPTLAMLPSPAITSKLLPIFLQDEVDVFLYPHQRTAFTRRQVEWRSRLSANPAKAAHVLTAMTQLRPTSNLPTFGPRLMLREPVEMDAESSEKRKTATTRALWHPERTEQEIALLFQDEESSEEVFLKDELEGVVMPLADDPQDVFCTEALRITFDHQWSGFFAPDDRINVVVKGIYGALQVQPRYVRSLKDNDQVVVIHGHQRQNLYDLIISRVHKHPSIELHLALIRRWQEDVRVAYEIWQTLPPDILESQRHGARDLRGFLRRIQDRGSRLSAAPISWFKGAVLCPLDPEDLRRAAEVLDMGFERQYYRRIAQAANRLRGLHRGLANRLNRWLEDQAAGVTGQTDADVIDEELGLTFGDLRNSLLILRVKKLEIIPGPFLRSNLGQVEKEN